MEAGILLNFLPRLKTAVSDSVLSVSDSCLAKGLISETVYKRVLESGGTSEDKARTLILAVKKSTETDSRCFEFFLSVLDETLPTSSKDNLLLAMKNKFVEKSTEERSVVPAVHGTLPGVPLIRGEIVKRQTTFFGKLEDAIRQHERVCAEKIILEDRIKSKEDENQQFKSELDSLRSCLVDAALNVTKIEETKSRISACEAEMSALKGRIEELESIIEEQGMQVKRGKNAMSLGLMNMMSQLSFLARKEIDQVKQLSVNKESEYLAALRVKETQHKLSLDGKEQEVLEAKVKLAEKEQHRSDTFMEKNAQLLSTQRENQKLDGSVQELRMKSLQHERDLKDKDFKIKELELEINRYQQAPKGASAGAQKKSSGLTSWIKSKRKPTVSIDSTIESGYMPIDQLRSQINHGLSTNSLNEHYAVQLNPQFNSSPGEV